MFGLIQRLSPSVPTGPRLLKPAIVSLIVVAPTVYDCL